MARSLVKIPVNTIPWQNVDGEAIGDASEKFVNGFMDKSPTGQLYTQQRPGQKLFCDLATNEQVDGIFAWAARKTVVAVSNGNVYTISNAGIPTQIGTGLRIGTTVSFVPYFNMATQQDLLFMANGGGILYTDGVTVQSVPVPAPQYVVALDVIDTIMVACDDAENAMRYSAPGDPFTWDPLNSVRPDSLGDSLQTLTIVNRYIYLAGKVGTDMFYSTDDQLTPFARISGMFIDYGIISIYTLSRLDGSLIFLDHNRRVVTVTNNQVQTISRGIDSIIQSMDNVSDACGFSLKIRSKSFYLITFPSENRTFLYDFALECWYEWATWDETLAVFNSLSWKTYTNAMGIYGKQLVGSRNGGQIYSIGATQYTDDDSPIKCYRITGKISHGNLNLKMCHKLALRIKRGFNEVDTGKVLKDEQGNTITDEQGNPLKPEQPTQDAQEALCRMEIRFKDNNSDTWSNPFSVPLRNFGHTDAIWWQNRMGQYRTRQYEICYSGPTPFILVDMEEDVEVLAR